MLDHLGKPDVRDGRLDDGRREMRRLAALPNVWCKLSGLVTEADWDAWTPSGLRPYLDVAADAFGPDRLMIGSDWPVCTLASSYARTMGSCSTTWRPGRRPIATPSSAARRNASGTSNLDRT